MSKVTEVIFTTAAEMSCGVAKMVIAAVENTPIGSTQSWPDNGTFEGEGVFFAVYVDGIETIANLDGGRSMVAFTQETKGLRAVVHVDSTGYRVYTP